MSNKAFLILSAAVALPSGAGAKINVRCMGRGAPTVILTAGAGDDGGAWAPLQKRVAATTRVCAWDRPGFGGSDWNGQPLDVRNLTDSLEAGLRQARLAPPYLLVGHSLGSFESLMFAFRHPTWVAGIVLVDPAGPFHDQRFKRAAPASYAVIDRFQKAQLAQAHGADRALLQAMFSNADSRQLARAWRPLGSTPLIVLTAGKPPALPVTGEAAAQMPALQAAWSAMHDDIARLSRAGANRVVPGTTHYIYKDAPGVVIATIAEVVAGTRPRR